MRTAGVIAIGPSPSLAHFSSGSSSRGWITRKYSDGISCDLVALQQCHDPLQCLGKLLRICHVAAIETMTKVDAVVAIQNIAQSHLAQVMAALLVVDRKSTRLHSQHRRNP